MMEQNTLRKADIFSGMAIGLLGLFIILGASGMPMQDSYGGVQNVWYVSPALFPLFIGAMLLLLGLLLCRTALRSVGRAGVRSVFVFLSSSAFRAFLTEPNTRRFYAIVINLVVFVFLCIPRVDFFLAAILFLLVSFIMFYCGGDDRLNRLIGILLGGALLFLLFVATGCAELLRPVSGYPTDWFVLGLTAALYVHMRRDMKRRNESLHPLHLSALIAVLAPGIIGVIFKYFLLVPMPHEGLVVSVLDAVWYADFWS